MISKIGKGICCLIGIGKNDKDEDIEYMQVNYHNLIMHVKCKK